jgi:hypothetical protein
MQMQTPTVMLMLFPVSFNKQTHGHGHTTHPVTIDPDGTNIQGSTAPC